MLDGFPVTIAWRILGLRMEERPPAMEGSWEYIEQAAADKRQWMVLQLGGESHESHERASDLDGFFG
jgi:hypothetical protein